MTHRFTPARRQFLHHTARLAAAAALPALAASCADVPKLQSAAASASPPLDMAPLGTPAAAPVAVSAPAPAPAAQVSVRVTRALALVHTHTHEKIDLVYATGERYVPEALGGLNRFLRDHYSGEVGVMDPQMFDMLHRVQQALGCKGSFEVISGYRCPATNDKLRNKGGGGVAKKSLHMEGRAIDVRLPGVPLAELHEAALSLRAGGVGFYPQDQFVHLDTGRVRNW
ncbi:MAG: DUF882 domain-containing protein [Pseudomonadota bacterium]|nr:DUF882 domain-containing protein [Pseudomonadota bacterium]